MDINDLRSITILLAFLGFVAIVGWAYSGKRKSAFDEAAALPLDDDQSIKGGNGAGQQHN